MRYITTLFLMITLPVLAQNADDKVMSKKNGTYTINTTTLCNTAGYRGTTPLIVSVKKGKIVSVEALHNMESPQYFARVRQKMLPSYTGIKFRDHAKVNGVTGATMTSNAIKAHVAKAYEYYKTHK